MCNVDEQDVRIAKILLDTPLLDIDDMPEVSYEYLERYIIYLISNLNFLCHVTGVECFSWEERFVFGYGSETEHEKLKKKQPSHTDAFYLLNLDNAIDEDYGIFANVKRISDNKKFILPLADLKASDEHSANYQLLDDYSYWFVNNR